MERMKAEEKYNPPKTPAMKAFRKDPPEYQVRLFKTLEDLIYDEMGRWETKWKTKVARVRNIAKKHRVDIKTAHKAYIKARERFRAEVEYRNYLENKEYFDWLHTPEYYQYVREYLAEIDARYQARLEEFYREIDEGREHVICVDDVYDAQDGIDCRRRTECGFHGPLSHFAQTYQINKEQFLQILDAEKVEIVMGKGTFENQIFYDPAKDPKECACGRTITKEVEGLNRKLGAKDEKDFKCALCLGVTEEYVHEVAKYYRAGGCKMFG